MRKIKFRAWDGKNMIYDFSQDKNMLQILVGISDEDDCLEAFWEGEPNKMILMQFTGLLDKNGKEIYEGDIVKFWTGSTRNTKKGITEIVKWHESGMWIPFRDDSYIQDEQGDSFEGNKGFEVIGNIHQNPEL